MSEVWELIVQMGNAWVMVGANPREAAIQRLVEIGEPAVPALINRLKQITKLTTLRERHRLTYSDLIGDQQLIQSGIVSVLVKIGAPAVPALMEAWTEMDGTGRVAVGEVLVKIGQAAVPALMETLKHGNPAMQAKAAWALGEIKDASTVPALITAVKDKDNRVRESSIHALGKIKDMTAVPTLLEALADKTRDVRQGAALALIETLGKCETVDSVAGFEASLRKGFLNLAQTRWKKGEMAEIEVVVSGLMNACAQMKNRLASKRDILLDGRLMAPKRGRIYRQMERVRNG